MRLLDKFSEVQISFDVIVYELHIFRRVRKIAKSDFELRYVRPSARPHGTALLQVDRFCWNLIFEFFRNLSKKFKFR